jgi:hypothetical protein
MAHRIRHAMKQGPFIKKLRGTVEVDETFIGGKQLNRPLRVRRSGIVPKKVPVVALVTRSGKVRSFPVKRVSAKELKTAIKANVHKSATIYTDRWRAYTGIGKEYRGGQCRSLKAVFRRQIGLVPSFAISYLPCDASRGGTREWSWVHPWFPWATERYPNLLRA